MRKYQYLHMNFLRSKLISEIGKKPPNFYENYGKKPNILCVLDFLVPEDMLK